MGRHVRMGEGGSDGSRNRPQEHQGLGRPLAHITLLAGAKIILKYPYQGPGLSLLPGLAVRAELTDFRQLGLVDEMMKVILTP